MIPSAIKIGAWDVFHLENCRYALPKPKAKYILILRSDEPVMALFLNSKPNPWTGSYVAAPHEAMPFLPSKWSHIDCARVLEFHRDEMLNKKGELRDSRLQRKILNAVCEWPATLKRHKNRLNCPAR